ncbi:MAG: EscU/YscU/HrcU family type III secretion system export apparatus switch protein [Planctomycetota bacterium]|nr:EscU/YscU/HrcU family type III secretion system export apparatus switch protein [Planctomycetota bacterium]MDA1027152.1 EscU/YscU/HrcU family type III secretion system export apparatus switch protein [Planctomycetota bacterium]
MAEDLGEKTEDATPRKILKAREDGRIAKSTDLAGALLLTFVTLLLWGMAAPSIERLGSMLEIILSSSGESTTFGAAKSLEMAGIAAVVVLAPLSVAAWLAAYVGHFWQVGWLVSPKPIEPKLEKLSPLSGFKRIVGVQGLVKGAMDLGKIVIAMGVATVVSWRMHDVLVVLPQGGLMPGFALIGRLMLELALLVALALLILAMLDYIFQKWKHAKDHRMSKQEVKDEHKDSEGDPRVKQRRMQFARQIAMQRINQSVPTADVIVTNPEHISVAIRYDPESMHAPQVVAIGVDHVALRIRQIAATHSIPIVERKPLARLLHGSVKTGDFIPPDAYSAIAEVLAYVYRMNGRAA